VKELQSETSQMRDDNKKQQKKVHVQQLRHEESLQTLERVQENFREELGEQNNQCAQQTMRLREVEHYMTVIKNNSNVHDDNGSSIARLAQKALMTTNKGRSKYQTKKI